jgi:hypothetical protein
MEAAGVSVTSSNAFSRALSCPDLPFGGVLSEVRIERILTKYGGRFGVGQIYSTAVVLWSCFDGILPEIDLSGNFKTS